MNASITRNVNAVATNIDVVVHIIERNGLLEWEGSFSVPHDIVFDADEYTLELADGRSGQILICDAGITGGSSTKRLRFQGTGPLNRKNVI